MILFKWSSIRSVGNSQAARVTILFPVVGYLIVFNEFIVRYLHLAQEIVVGADINTDTTGEVSWRLLSLYMGLMVIALASVIYQIFCPAVVKAYPTSVDYIAIVRPNLGGAMIDRIATQLDHLPNPDNREKLVDPVAKRRSEPVTVLEKEKFLNDVLDWQYAALDITKTTARISSACLFLAGFFLTLIPSADVFCRVIKIVISQL